MLTVEGVAAKLQLPVVVAALDQDRRLDALDQFFRRILVEDNHKIDRLKRRQHFGTRLHRLNRAPGAFKPCHRGVAIQTQHKAVASPARAGQQPDVAGMQQIEAAIGEKA